MKIVEGRYYRTRDGRKVGPMEPDHNAIFLVWDCPNTGESFHKDGSYNGSGRESPDDLIAEWSDDPHTFTHSDGRTVDLTAITTPFGLLDEETQAALKEHGGPYEFFHGDACWLSVAGSPLWVGATTYRAKPAPKVETVTVERFYNRRSNQVINDRKPGAVLGTLTTTLQDGKPVKAVWEADQ
ncbi:hypothetical protein PVV74_17200 [Roseovarius sp. SK2]|uniref:hypothetical protein n=1 Tax=Roseovarius TaxID=74030 RepID=UPI00237A7365|nr:hypothetical protein [Roseovarius sp. SK2]MDD9727200.1 hypothetical protein [Roseovarius sp. SK2]